MTLRAMKRVGLLAAVMMLGMGFSARAQMPDDRIMRLERDLQLLQRQVYRQQGGAAAPADGSAAAQASVQAMQREEEMRRLNGTLEQLQHQINRLQTTLQQLEEDVDFRLQEVEKQQQALVQAMQAAAAVPAAGMPVAAGSGNPALVPMDEGAAALDNTSGELPKPATDAVAAGQTETIQPPVQNGQFTSPRAHYNYAFGLLNQGKFKDARAALLSFIQSYPKDPLVGNAYYWAGETYYADKDYANASLQFQKGYEVMPTGPKAPDNLYKLGVSIAQLGKVPEACVVLASALAKHPNASKELAQKIQAESKRLKCE